MRGPTDRLELGRRGEGIAAGYLTGQGYEILARNWRTAGGELDLVARDGEWLVVVEVRTRRAAASGEGLRFGAPEQSITLSKQARLARTGAAYVDAAEWAGPWRIDVIALEIDRRGCVTRLNHLRDAVGAAAGGG